MAEERSEEGAVKNLGLGSGLEIEAKPWDCGSISASGKLPTYLSPNST